MRSNPDNGLRRDHSEVQDHTDQKRQADTLVRVRVLARVSSTGGPMRVQAGMLGRHVENGGRATGR
ncbi:MAG: hypothetical protein FWD17_10515 [Polyangiaceae bacterium]|nr:hypothetical protein [Polyangiaceae bacterium]